LAPRIRTRSALRQLRFSPGSRLFRRGLRRPY
jgi:hypothetical protein